MRTWNAQIQKFFFTPMPGTWLAVLRFGLGLVIVLYALSLRNDWIYLFAGTGHGLISRDLGEAILSLDGALIPRLGWLIVLGSHIGLPEKTVLFLTWVSLVVAGWGLIVGLFSRFSAIVAWFVHLCAAKSGGLVTYGVDNFIIIGLFYLMLSPLPDKYSLDHLWLRWNLKNGQLLGFYRRALQIHLCLIYFFGGITKCLGSGWWDGSNIWRAVTRPPFNIIPVEVFFRLKYFLPAIGIAICLIETGYPLFIWLKKTRLVWLVFVVGMHVMIGLTMGMYLFALVMIVLNIAAFGPDFSFFPFAILRRLRGYGFARIASIGLALLTANRFFAPILLMRSHVVYRGKAARRGASQLRRMHPIFSCEYQISISDYTMAVRTQKSVKPQFGNAVASGRSF